MFPAKFEGTVQKSYRVSHEGQLKKQEGFNKLRDLQSFPFHIGREGSPKKKNTRVRLVVFILQIIKENYRLTRKLTGALVCYCNGVTMDDH